jgi:glutamyl-Q tRNA(Asp) synthetase
VTASQRYRGRFAPSPTGALHIGSLACALASFLDARAAGGEWLVRMEDLDPPREKPGAASDILRTLEAHGLQWDGEVEFQSRRRDLYEDALTNLVASGHAFSCALSRTQLDSFGSNHPGRAVSAAQIIQAPASRNPADVAWRMDVPDADVCFTDRIQGKQAFNIARSGGPFVIRRRDGLFAYQLAVVVDDAAQGITDIVRGADLLDSTPRQILLQRALALPEPSYAHIPVLTDSSGEKLSKQQEATPVAGTQALANLRLALHLLGQAAPGETATPAELLAAAIAAWRPDAIPRQLTTPASAEA